jgi:glucuronokinase
MVATARSVGASAKFTGSGGAIIGTYDDEAMLLALRRALGAIRVDVVVPSIAPALPVPLEEV